MAIMKNFKWTDKEIEILIHNHGNKSLKDIAKIMGRSLNSVTLKANSIGLRSYNHWTNNEIVLLKSQYAVLSTKELKILFSNHTLGSINKKAKTLDLKRKNVLKPVWTKEENSKLVSLFNQGKSDAEIALILKRSASSVAVKTGQLRYKLRQWTETELKMLKELFCTTRMQQLLKIFKNKSKTQIQKKANALGLYKPASFLWSEEEVKILEHKYPICTIKELVIIFPTKSAQQINKKAKRLKLKKTEETLRRCFNLKDGDIPTKFPSQLTRWRKTILKRDHYKCQECLLIDKTAINLQAHHIIPKRDCTKKQKYDVSNGITLCKKCHKDIKNKEYLYKDKYLRIIATPEAYK